MAIFPVVGRFFAGAAGQTERKIVYTNTMEKVRIQIGV